MAATLLTDRGYWGWSAGAQLARLPVAMAPLAFTATTAALTGSYGTGAAMVAAEAVAEVVCAVPVGRALDRFGVARGARLLLVLRGLAYVGVLAAVTADVPAAVLVGLAAVPGTLGGGVLGGFRAMLTGVVGPSRLSRAVAVNAMVVEGVIVGGPVLVALLAAAAAAGPLAAMAAASMLAALFVPRTATPPRSAAVAGVGELVRPLAGWACAAFAFGHVTSTIEVAALPLAQRLGGGAGAAAGLVAALSVASVLGGIAYVAAKRDGGRRTACGLLVVLAAGSTTAALGRDWPVVVVGAVMVGVCAAPLFTILSVRAEHLVAAHRRAEGFALLATAQGLGFAVGALSLSALPLSAVGPAGSVSALLAVPLLLRADPPGRRAPAEAA